MVVSKILSTFALANAQFSISKPQNIMKRTIPTIIILAIIIFATLRTCWGGEDVPSSEEKETPLVPIDENLKHKTDSFLAAMPPVGSVGILLYDMTAQRDIYAYNDLTPKRPASCMKLLSCIAALDKYGTSYKYRTQMIAQGKQIGDTLVGNLVLKTHFDPFFNRDSLILMVRKVRETGIKAVKGKVLVDMAFTEPMQHEEHWTMGDLKTRRLGLIYQGSRRMCTELTWALNGAGITFKNTVQKGEGTNTTNKVVFGRLNPHDAKVLAETVTPIHYVIEKALKNSSNINAESLLYLLGYSVKHDGNYRNNGIVALNRFIEGKLKSPAMKYADDSWRKRVIHDGCGLCPDDHLTPRLLVTLLEYASQRPALYREVFEDLPLSGTDGTLHDRMRKPHTVGKVKAKTGTLTREGGISTLAGYFTGADGHKIAFAIMNNECPVMDGRWWQDKYFERVP